MNTVKQKQTKPFPIYPEIEVLEKMKNLAAKHNRSINGEIMTAIKDYLAQYEQQKPLSP